jgi:hypothetical protein
VNRKISALITNHQSPITNSSQSPYNERTLIQDKSPVAGALIGLAGAFVAAVNLARAIRPALLLDPDPTWAISRLFLGLVLLAGTAAAGVAVAGTFLLFARTRAARGDLGPLPFPRWVLALLASAAILGGTALRFVRLDRLPWPVFIDESSFIAPALQLEGRWCDFRDSIRPAPYRAKPFTMVGVLFLEGLRASLLKWGATVYAVRVPAAIGSAASVATAGLLGWMLLPSGGGALAALTLAGLRWHLNLSRWAWCPTTLMVTTDIATLLLLAARRRRSATIAALGGLVVGLGAHVYLSAWVAAAALAAFAAWPAEGGRARLRLRLAAAYLLGLGISVAPLFLFREGRVLPYFNRANDHNVLREVRYNRSVFPIAAAAADAFSSPWLLPDPTRRHDLPLPRLELLAIPLAVALARSLLSPRRELSAVLLLQGGAALGASVAGGQSGNPNGLRFGYLATLACVAIAAGLLALLNLAPLSARRTWAVAVAGCVLVASGWGVHEFLAWSRARDTFDGFHGQDTIVGRAALRWDAYGRVRIDSRVPHDPVTVYVIRRYRLDPDDRGGRSDFWKDRPGGRALRIAPPATPPQDGERVVEKLRDAWGREWGVVLARPRSPLVAGS